MPTRRFALRLGAVALSALVFTGLPSCGGGSDSGTASPVARFTPDTPAPGPGSIVMLAGTSNGTAVNVRIAVTGVDDMLGAAFRVEYDPSALFFNGMNDSASFLRQGVTDANVFFEANQSTVVGEIVITATRLDPTVAAPVDVGTTADMVVLNFSARRRIAAGDAGGVLTFIDPRDVQVCAAPPACTSSAVTWSGGAVTAQ